MTNWCSNYITFSGKESDIKKVLKEFKDLDKETKDKPIGKKFKDREKSEDSYMFGIYIREDYSKESNINSVSYDTKLTPNLIDIKYIADKYNLNFKFTYEEYGSRIYGIIEKKDGRIFKYELTNEDLDKLQINIKDNICIYNGREYEEYEGIEMMLKDKMKELKKDKV